MSDLTFPPPHSENAELAAANRRLTTAILGMTLLTGLIACLSYLAGRTVTHIRSETATVVRTEIPPGPVVITPLQTPTPATPQSSTAPQPAPGLYLQVGLIDPAIDRTMQDKLLAKGYGVQLAPMANSPVSRLLVGPIQSGTHLHEMEARLTTDGFQHFLRRF